MSRYLMAAGGPSRRSALYHGKGRIAGVSPGLLTVDGTPAARDIVVLRRDQMTVVARIKSRTDGTYELGYLDQALMFTVFGWDNLNQHNAAIVDIVTPALMPEFGG